MHAAGLYLCNVTPASFLVESGSYRIRLIDFSTVQDGPTTFLCTAKSSMAYHHPGLWEAIEGVVEDNSPEYTHERDAYAVALIVLQILLEYPPQSENEDDYDQSLIYLLYVADEESGAGPFTALQSILAAIHLPPRIVELIVRLLLVQEPAKIVDVCA